MKLLGLQHDYLYLSPPHHIVISFPAPPSRTAARAPAGAALLAVMRGRCAEGADFKATSVCGPESAV